MNDIVWDNIMLKEFRSLARLSPDEEKVLQHWADSKSVVESSFLLSVSPRTIDRIRDRIRYKYDAVQIYTPLLPKRNILS